MATKNLQQVINQMNFIRMVYKKDPITITELDQDVVDSIVEHIDFSLSPENLYCDGEISYLQARSNGIMLGNALKEIEALGFAINIPKYSDFFS